LRELQADMVAVIMRPLAAGHRMQAQSRRAAQAIIKPNSRLTSFERLEIYNRQYWFRIIDCIYDDYPGLRAVLGDTKFDRLTKAYLTRHPSTSFTLRNLGHQLVPFLRDEMPLGRLALDMARLEWAHTVAFDEATRPIVTADDLLGKKPTQIRLGLQPYVTLLDVRYPVDDILLDAKKHESLRSEASHAVAERQVRVHRRRLRTLRPQPIWIAAHRVNRGVYYKRLTRGEYEILSALQQGATLAQACARATGISAEQVQHSFRAWSSFGWFCQR